MKVRPYISKDFIPVANIYQEGIATGIATFETEVPDELNWNKKFIKDSIFIAEKNSKIIGWCALSHISTREVYKGVAEVTVYISSKYRGQGIGKILLKHLISESEKNGFWTLQASIFSENKASIFLHETCGFRIVGSREKIAKRDHIWHDNVLMERRSHLF